MSHYKAFLIGCAIALAIALGVECFGQYGGNTGAYGSVTGVGGGTNSQISTVFENAQGTTLNLWPSSSGFRIITLQTNAGFTLSSFVPAAGANFSAIQLNVSNSSASPYLVTITAACSLYSILATNNLTIPAGQMGYIYVDEVAGSSTNMANAQ